VYRPSRHKTQHRGLDRVVFLGPRAQEAVGPFLVVTCPRCGRTDRAHRLGWRGGLCGPCADLCDREGVCGPWPVRRPDGDYYLFTPRDHVEALRARRAAERVSKRTPSQLSRQRKARRARRARTASLNYLPA
jgi:hypothetical protein